MKIQHWFFKNYHTKKDRSKNFMNNKKTQKELSAGKSVPWPKNLDYESQKTSLIPRINNTLCKSTAFNEPCITNSSHKPTKIIPSKIITYKDRTQDRAASRNSNFQSPFPSTSTLDSNSKTLSRKRSFLASSYGDGSSNQTPGKNSLAYNLLKDHLKKIEIKPRNKEYATRQRRSRQNRKVNKSLCNSSIYSHDSSSIMGNDVIKTEHNGQKSNRSDILNHKRAQSRINNRSSKNMENNLSRKNSKTIIRQTPEKNHPLTLRDLNAKSYLARKYLDEIYEKILIKVKEIERNGKMAKGLKEFQKVIVVKKKLNTNKKLSCKNEKKYNLRKYKLN